MKYPITISAVKPTKRTARITNLSTVGEILKAKADGTLFNVKGAALDAILEDVYNGKLKASQKEILKAMTEDERRAHAIDILTYQLELNQEAPRKSKENPDRVNTVGFFMSARLNVSNQTANKKFWLTITTNALETYNFKKDMNFSELMFTQEGQFTHILRLNSFDPELNDAKRIVSPPKRAGAGGDILTKGGRIIFQHVEFVQQNVEDESQLEALAEEFAQEEFENGEAFKHDGTIDSVLNVIPVEERNKETGEFNEEFQAWLHEQVGVGQGLQVAV